MKAIHVRDAGTHYGVLALRLNEADAPEVIDRGGFRPAEGYLVLVHLTPELRAEWDPYAWDDPTLRAAHLHLLSGGYEAVANGGDLHVERLRAAMAEVGA